MFTMLASHRQKMSYLQDKNFTTRISGNYFNYKIYLLILKRISIKDVQKSMKLFGEIINGKNYIFAAND